MWSIQWIAFKTIVGKEVTRFMRIWPQTLLPPLINQSLYFIIFGAFIGAQIQEMQGVPYMSFILPGLVMMGVINSSFANVVSSFFGSKFQHSIEEILVSPTSKEVVLAGYTFGGMLRGLLVGVLIFAVAFFFVEVQVMHPFFIVAFLFLTSTLFALAGFLNGLFARKFDDISVFQTFILTPLTYFGGVFYSIESLPPLFQTLSKFNPILYMVDGFRFGFFGFSDVNVWMSLAFLSTCCLGLGLLNWELLRRGYGLRV
ncbi:ABC transporter permease [Candidatus Peregrinibacteria bacterium]|nr:MAG: ABC transporter permease [Candidatus Peregrinibacteria bacterium]